MLNIFWNRMKDFRQIIPMIAGMTALALVLIAVFGMSFSGADKPDVIIVDQDNSHISQAYAETLVDLGGFDFKYRNYQEGLDLVSAGRAVASVVIEKGFGEGLLMGDSKVSMLRAGESIEQMTIQANLEGAGRQLVMEEGFLMAVPPILEAYEIEADLETLRGELREQANKYPALTVTAVTYDGNAAQGYDSLRHSFIGFILFFSMFTMVFGIGAIVEDKENRVWQRQTVAPVSLVQVMAGNMLATFTISMIQLTLMVIISRLVFGIDWGGSLLALLLVLSAYVIAATALGLLMTTFTSTMQQLGSFSPIVIVSTSMVGGCMWPLEIISSKALLFAADLTPQRWAYKGLKAVIINNGGISDVLSSVVILLVMASVFFVLGMVPYMNSLKKRLADA